MHWVIDFHHKLIGNYFHKFFHLHFGNAIDWIHWNVLNLLQFGYWMNKLTIRIMQVLFNNLTHLRFPLISNCSIHGKIKALTSIENANIYRTFIVYANIPFFRIFNSLFRNATPSTGELIVLWWPTHLK